MRDELASLREAPLRFADVRVTGGQMSLDQAHGRDRLREVYLGEFADQRHQVLWQLHVRLLPAGAGDGRTVNPN